MTPYPNLFIVGAPRAATTALWYYLSQHPEIFMSELKEPHYFCRVKPSIAPRIDDEESYLRLFGAADGKRVIGEASPSYLADTEAPSAIKRTTPEARIVVIVRDPVTRAFSEYWHAVKMGGESRSFADATQQEMVQEGRNADGSQYLANGLYSQPLRRYLELFGEKVLVLVFEEFTRDVRGGLGKVLEFVGVDPAFDAFDTAPRNTFSLPRNRIIGALYASQTAHRVARRLVSYPLQWQIERLLLVHPPRPRIDPGSSGRLARFYESDIAELEEILCRRLPWLRPENRAKGTMARRD